VVASARGTGLLFVRADFAERLRPPGIGGNSALWEDAGHYSMLPGAQRFAEVEASIAGHLGLGVAIDHALRLGLEAIADRVDALGERLRGALGAIDGVTAHDGGHRRSGIVTFTTTAATPAEVAEAASSVGINVWTSSAPSARLDMSAPGPTTVVRASPHYYNTEDELDRLTETVRSLVDQSVP
jgi:selenocysteine lyase/cysteine desulfurase